jgi:hypothetical protein
MKNILLLKSYYLLRCKALTIIATTSSLEADFCGSSQLKMPKSKPILAFSILIFSLIVFVIVSL